MLSCTCCPRERAFSSARLFSTLKEQVIDDLPRLPSSSQPLGYPLPEDEHACSVSLPTWASVVGYEEGDPAVTSAMKCGYPRFVYHPYVIELMRYVIQHYGSKEEDCLVLPSEEAALRCQMFLQLALESRRDAIDNALVDTTDHAPAPSPGSRIRLVEVGGVHAVLFPAQTTAGMEAKAYWQHTGEVVSSRRAEHVLTALGVEVPRVTVGPCPATAPYYMKHSCQASTLASTQMRDRVAQWANVEADHVFLTPSGMSSIYTALRSARRYRMSKGTRKGGRSIVFGFPYLDTLKLCSRAEFCPDGVEFFGYGHDEDMDHLERLLQSRSHEYCAVFTEVPSNPLLQCPDLPRLRRLADEYDFMLVVDDTISNFLNIDIVESGLADAVCSSLTKLVSGRGDAMAGSVVANPRTERGRWMQEDLARARASTLSPDFGLFQADAAALLANSVDFVERNAQINATAEGLADWLEEHPNVDRVYYPKQSAPYYQSVKKPHGGYGGLMSMTLPPHMCQRTFYDALDVAKGPSLGTDFTLVCPYTLLAHYHELDFAVSYHVPPNLLRIAVGLEPLEVLQDKFSAAFRQSQLFPKVCLEGLSQRRSFSTSAKQSSSLASPELRQALRRVSRLLR